ncbi:inositol monophosphatase family protein [Oricola thermophila]|uniref:Inositol-1-monophosphatase n=1 Tax=Oricola thermophila TaxID=2742145 RepID=A0A6N1VDE3_9HYPH|nr:inositol monophosphatase [Oricola thermophila]QKV17179.1 inositol monophosphatase [Oricola thermophila]
MHNAEDGRACAQRIDAAMSIIRDAGRMALDYFERYRSLAVEEKSGGQDIVSIADRAVESLIREAILDRFGEDGIVGEEHGNVSGSSGFQWLVDPIDGTGSFLHGLQTWSVVIAILRDGEPVAGLVLEPCTGRLYRARCGEGAFCDDAPIAVDTATPFTGGLFAIGASRPEASAHIGAVVTGVLAAGGGYMRNGSAALSLAHVAAGHYLGFYEPQLNAWDCVAGLLIVSEAGGTADDFLGDDGVFARKPCFAAAPQAAPLFRQIVNGEVEPLEGTR